MKNKKKLYILIIIISVILIITISIFINTKIDDKKENNNTINSAESNDSINIDTSTYDEYDLDDSSENADAIKIELNNDNSKCDSANVTIRNNVITITKGGTYYITGNLDSGSIEVEAPKENVKIILAGVNITSKDSSAIYIKKSKKTVITLEKDTVNFIKDTSNYTYDDVENQEPNSTIFSKSDLTINGLGTLNIEANFEDALVSKDILKIMNGIINIKSIDDGIRGTDKVIIKEGTITINSESDGIKSTSTDLDKGNILIENGNITIISGQDGIQAENELYIKNGKFDIKTGGGSNNSSNSSSWGIWGNSKSLSDTSSAKALKANNKIIIELGEFNLDSSDDTIHSNNEIVISDGTYKITSGDDGIHSDTSIKINGGDIDIKKSYGGIESSIIEINEGNIYVTSSDDGINLAGGNDSSSIQGRPGQNNFNTNSNNKLTINAGYIVVDASGDGIDLNGSGYMDGGIVIVNGPTNDGNGALDYDGVFEINAGLLIASGSSGMLQTASNSSKINCLTVVFSSKQKAGNIINIRDSNNKDILTFAPAKQYQSIVICSNELKSSETYTVYSGGSYSGEEKDGLYQNGTYIEGSKLSNITINNIINTIGNIRNNGMMR